MTTVSTKFGDLHFELKEINDFLDNHGDVLVLEVDKDTNKLTEAYVMRRSAYNLKYPPKGADGVT